MWVSGDGWYDNGGVIHTRTTDFDRLGSIIDDNELLDIDFGLDKFALVDWVVRSSELGII